MSRHQIKLALGLTLRPARGRGHTTTDITYEVHTTYHPGADVWSYNVLLAGARDHQGHILYSGTNYTTELEALKEAEGNLRRLRTHDRRQK